MKKKIILISTYVLCALLVGAILTLSLMKFNSMPNYNNPDRIEIYAEDSTNARILSDGSEECCELLKKIKQGFSEQYIQALFAGRASNNYDVNADTLNVDKPYLKLKYEVMQNLIINGKNVKDPSKTSNDIKYNEIYIPYAETNAKKDIRIQYRNSDTGSVWYITCNANLSYVFEYINK